MEDKGRSAATLPPVAPSDLVMVMAKSRENRLAFATWFIVFRDHGRLPRGPSDLATVDTAPLAAQIGVTVPTDGGVVLAERTAKRLRTEIRARFGFREATVADAQTLTDWLRDYVAAEAGGPQRVQPSISTSNTRFNRRAQLLSRNSGRSAEDMASGPISSRAIADENCCQEYFC